MHANAEAIYRTCGTQSQHTGFDHPPTSILAHATTLSYTHARTHTGMLAHMHARVCDKHPHSHIHMHACMPKYTLTLYLSIIMKYICM